MRRTIGGGRGLRDGTGDAARFAEPLGLALLPPAVADAVGYDLVVADSGNHALRGVRLADGAVTTVAGTGAQLRTRVAPATTVPHATPLSTPWDVAWWDGHVVVAMAGCHQLWTFDPVAATLTVLLGTADEGLRDGGPGEAFFAQPSGLAADGDALWVADAESSALRTVDRAAGPRATTAVGQGLFDFGLRDGPAFGEPPALLQHPLGVAMLPDGSVAVADTYNGAVRHYDPATRVVSTLADGLAEPSDVLVDGPDPEHVLGGNLVVVESAAHRLVRVPLPAHLRAAGRAAAGDGGGGARAGHPAGAVQPARGAARRPPVRRAHLADRHGPRRVPAGRRGDGTRSGAGAAARRVRAAAGGRRRGRLRRGRRLRRVSPVPAGVGRGRAGTARGAHRARPRPARLSGRSTLARPS